MNHPSPITLFVLGFAALMSGALSAQSSLTAVSERETHSLNGQWQVIIDPFDVGHWRRIWEERKPEKKGDFVEYGFEGGPVLNVPGDFNSQLPELALYEGTVWYKKSFDHQATSGRLFLHFGAVNYLTTVYLNGQVLGKHEGGFTPFQFEVTGKVRSGSNSLIVEVNNQRQPNGLPATGYDWFNYGGITRDVTLVQVPSTFISNYHVQLKKGSQTEVSGWVKLVGEALRQNLTVRIPELNIRYNTHADSLGMAPVSFSGTFQHWSPESPKRYRVWIESETDTVSEWIGFRSVENKGAQILLNGKPIFLRGVNIHEEIPMKAARATSLEDARMLLSWAKELGCNFVRLAHYPHSEHIVRLADEMGLMVWSELPIYQHISFTDPEIPRKMETMLLEMVERDRNRCSLILWGISNETYPSAPNRTEALSSLTSRCRELDPTRLITSATNSQRYTNHTFEVWDPLYEVCDVIALNEYIGWYEGWQGDPEKTQWKVAQSKPLIISEFGGEALFGQAQGPTDEAAYWTEEYMADIYKKQVAMFGTIPNLAGACPWLLADYRSPVRMNPVFQQGWNRKGLLSDKGEKKKAWYVMREYYAVKAKSGK